LKLIACCFVFERIEESHAASKLRLRAGSAGDREGHRPEPLFGVVVRRGVLSEAG